MKTVKIGIIQTSCTENIELNVKNTLEYILKSIEKGAQIICLPEMYRTLYFCQTQDYEAFKTAETIPGPSTNIFSEIAKKHEVVIIAPLFEKRADGLYHNTIAVIDADGSIIDIYRKMHIPHDPGFEEKFYFAPGDLGFKAIKTKYATIGTLICWDQWYPEAARITTMKGAQILFYPTAIGWDSKEPDNVKPAQLDAWKTIQRSHSIANGCFVCAVNRIGTEQDLHFWGNSFVSNTLGEVIFSTDHTTQSANVVEINLDEIDDTRTHWPFFRDRRTDFYQDLSKRWLD
ncbi:MAG: acyltransferase [Cytophagales bacterium]|nr:MAG: acyltransferase [Cytophagales bacterium]